MDLYLTPSRFLALSCRGLLLSSLFCQAQAASLPVHQDLDQQPPDAIITAHEPWSNISAITPLLDKRQATMCGKNSPGGKVRCGLNLCCSATGWCGTTEAHCVNGDRQGGTLPCQSGFGSCKVAAPPSCSPDGGSTRGRTVGYYQAWNVRDRKCDKVSPKQINTQGFTHLLFAFATIDPATFKVGPTDPGDVVLMKEFTALSKGGKLQTWIAVGGGDFSHPGTPTHRTWSVMSSTAANRAAFISSLKSYMEKYEFQGADLDWEFPAVAERGGKPEDTQNFVKLVKEMRAAFGAKFGISLPLPADFGSLQGYSPSAMQQYVDFFNFMAYDLDGSVDGAGTVRGQSDIRDIEKGALPLWFDGVKPAKINFGLATYGRGYTLANKACNKMLDCKSKGLSKAAGCTNSKGAMSLKDIQGLVKQKSLTPEYVAEARMKQITWDDQWIGYDDVQSFEAKKRWADSMCFGGTMYWAVDFQ